MIRSFFCFLFLQVTVCFSQTPVDSLVGFSVGATRIEAALHGCYGNEANVYLKKKQRSFIKAKFNLDSFEKTPAFFSKFNPATTANLPCVDEDFEVLPTGTLSSTAWVAQVSNNFSMSSVPCATTAVSYVNNNSLALVVNTPVTDVQCNNVLQSPFGGSKVLQLNRGNFNTVPTRIAQTFSVTNSNYIYHYAYKGVLNAAGQHSCCEQPFIFFKFYNCSGAPITLFENSILSGSCSTSPDNAYWSNNNDVYYTPNWVMHTLNLSAYINSCITVEIVVAGCIFTGHDGYLYYDAKCSNVPINPTDILFANSVPGNSFTTCVQTPTLSGLGGLTNYLWSGPSASGITSSTMSSVTTSVSGVYSLSAMNGTTVLMQTLSLTINPLPVLSMQGNSLHCIWGVSTYSATGNAATYSWSTGSNANTATISPAGPGVISVVGTSSLGCTSSVSLSYSVANKPIITLNTPSTNSFCPGDTFSLTAINSLTPGTLLWNTGATASVIALTPTQSGVYSVTSTAVSGCSSVSSVTLTMNPQAQVSVTIPNAPICELSTFVLVASAPGAVNYLWTGIATTNTLGYSAIAGLHTFSVTAFNNSSCSSSVAITVTVYPIPTVTITRTPSAPCLGQMLTLTAQTNTGPVSYLWNGNSTGPTLTLMPTQIAWFNLLVVSSFGCSNTASHYINPQPVVGQLQAFGVKTVVCAGESSTIQTQGTNIVSYLWSNGDTTSYTIVNPLSTSIYSVTGIDKNGCLVSSSEQIVVTLCTEFSDLSKNDKISVYPNPSTGHIVILSLNGDFRFILYAANGQKVNEGYNQRELDLTIYPRGIYFLEIRNSAINKVKKIVLE